MLFCYFEPKSSFSQEWRNQGLPLSTTSNEAAKLYDAAISQVLFEYGNNKLLHMVSARSCSEHINVSYLFTMTNETCGGFKSLIRPTGQVSPKLILLTLCAHNPQVTGKINRYHDVIRICHEDKIQ